MKVTQSRVVPLVVVIAIVAAVVATFMFRGQFVFGHEDPAECATSNVGLSIVTFDENGAKITRVSNGMEVFYEVRLSFAELPTGEVGCNYGEGALAITLPNGEVENVAGYEGGPEVPLIRPGFVYRAPTASYTVDQNDAKNLVLTALATYTGGISHSEPDPGEHPTAASALAAQIQMALPSIEIEVTPATQNIYEGGTADFTVILTNTGGFDLSNLEVVDTLDTTCEQSFESLAVGARMEFDCSMTPALAATDAFTVTADVTGGVPEVLSSVEDSTSAIISIEGISVSIEMSPELQRVRVGNDAGFEITVTNPNTTGLIDVAVSVPEAPDCDRAIGAMEAGGSVLYTCTHTYEASLVSVEATVEGVVVDVATVTDSVEVEVDTFELDFVIDATPDEPTIREGETVDFTVTVTNYGPTEITAVSVLDNISPDCSRQLGTLEAYDESDADKQYEATYKCTSEELFDDLQSLLSATGTAPDGDPVQDSDVVEVTVLRPNTSVTVSEVDTMVLRLVVQVLTITETNTGDSPLTDVYVQVEPAGVRLDITSDEYLGGDEQDDGVLSPGETWEWRFVTISLAGDSVILDRDSEEVSVEATGHGTDPLGGDITLDTGYVTEQNTLVTPIRNTQ